MTGQRGFSLTEVLLTVLAAATTIAMVVPTMTNASRSLKLMTVAKEIEGQLQNTRFTAINKNRSTSLVFSSDGSWFFWISMETAPSMVPKPPCGPRLEDTR